MLAIFLIIPAKAQELSPIIKIYPFAAADAYLIKWQWITSLDYKKISDWAKTYHCTVNNDDAPLIDNTAWFVSKYGSQLVFENLDDVKYFLHINFVTFDNPDKTTIDALCFINCNNMIVKKLSFKEMTGKNSRIIIEIGREYIVNKTLNVEFKEYSSAGGFFGVWDVILSKEDILPENIAESKSQTKEKPLKQLTQPLVKPKK